LCDVVVTVCASGKQFRFRFCLLPVVCLISDCVAEMLPVLGVRAHMRSVGVHQRESISAS